MNENQRIMLSPVDGTLPEAWLSRFDANPTLLPQWPLSDRMALVCVREIGEGPDGVEAVVVLSPEQLKEISDPVKHGITRLFFKVQRSKLLEDPELCPGLSPESFWSQED